MTPEQARRRFAQARVARLATADAGGRPHLVPIADSNARIVEAGESEGRDAVARLLARYSQYRAWPPHGPVVAIDVARWSSWSAAGS